MDTPAVSRITATGRKNPRSRTATTGFDRRAEKAEVEVPGWIHTLAERGSPELAGFAAALFYRPTQGSDQGNASSRATKAEGMARAVERARRQGRPGLVADYTTELDDDSAFYDAIDQGRPWMGRWYSREPAART